MKWLMNANMDKMKYNEEYIVNNRLKNLIGVVNLDLENKSGIRAALSYRIGGKDNKYDEVDSSDIVKKAYRIVYGENIPESADTILKACRLIEERSNKLGELKAKKE